VTMTVDRPFIFIIADMENKDILFAGKIVNI
jgi:serine protease inhibitor